MFNISPVILHYTNTISHSYTHKICQQMFKQKICQKSGVCLMLIPNCKCPYSRYYSIKPL